jgi:hypothetical protein
MKDRWEGAMRDNRRLSLRGCACCTETTWTLQGPWLDRRRVRKRAAAADVTPAMAAPAVFTRQRSLLAAPLRIVMHPSGAAPLGIQDTPALILPPRWGRPTDGQAGPAIIAAAMSAIGFVDAAQLRGLGQAWREHGARMAAGDNLRAGPFAALPDRSTSDIEYAVAILRACGFDDPVAAYGMACNADRLLFACGGIEWDALLRRQG